MRHVTAEDIAHLQSRFVVFTAQAKLVGAFKTTTPCAHHMSKWIVEGAQAALARPRTQAHGLK